MHRAFQVEILSGKAPVFHGKPIDDPRTAIDGVYWLVVLEHALEAASQTVAAEPDSPDVYSDRACVNVELEQYEEAISDLTKAIELAPRDPEFHQQRATVYLAMGRDLEAAADEKAAARME